MTPDHTRDTSLLLELHDRKNSVFRICLPSQRAKKGVLVFLPCLSRKLVVGGALQNMSTALDVPTKHNMKMHLTRMMLIAYCMNELLISFSSPTLTTFSGAGFTITERREHGGRELFSVAFSDGLRWARRYLCSTGIFCLGHSSVPCSLGISCFGAQRCSM